MSSVHPMKPVTDPYRALGVPRAATEADIKTAHRRLAKRYHPDATGGDSDRFLKVQEAYRVLSDPLLRREWDAAHAGPLRADRPAAPRPRRARPERRGAAPAAEAATDQSAPPGQERDRTRDAPDRSSAGRPRSARAYTWRATEVPWWEEGASRKGGRQKKRAQGTDSTADGVSEAGMGDTAPVDDAQHADAPQDFDVYNRSSGAAWSMAARAYFRRGEQDLPRRGSFRHQGTQPITAARARAAAEAEARRPPSAPRSQPARPAARPSQRPASHASPPPPRAPAGGAGAPAYAYASAGVARDPERVAHVRQAYERRTRALAWPSLRQRLLYALIAWLPLALLVGYGYTQYTGCGPLFMECSQSPEPALLVAVGILLVFLVAVPKIAYAGAMGTLAMLLVAAAATGILAYMRAPLPPATAALIVLGVVMGIAYVTMMLIVALRGGPWRWAEPR